MSNKIWDGAFAVQGITCSEAEKEVCKLPSYRALDGYNARIFIFNERDFDDDE